MVMRWWIGVSEVGERVGIVFRVEDVEEEAIKKNNNKHAYKWLWYHVKIIIIWYNLQNPIQSNLGLIIYRVVQLYEIQIQEVQNINNSTLSYLIICQSNSVTIQIKCWNIYLQLPHRSDLNLNFMQLHYSYTAALCSSYYEGKTHLHGTTILAGKSYP